MIRKIKKLKIKVKHTICPYHKKHPKKSYAGCTCSSVYAGKEVNGIKEQK